MEPGLQEIWEDEEAEVRKYVVAKLKVVNASTRGCKSQSRQAYLGQIEKKSEVENKIDGFKIAFMKKVEGRVGLYKWGDKRDTSFPVLRTEIVILPKESVSDVVEGRSLFIRVRDGFEEAAKHLLRIV